MNAHENRRILFVVTAALALSGGVTGCATSARSGTDPAHRDSAGLPPTSITKPQAEKLFERFKALAGEWDSKSTKGWGGRIGYEVMADGSCVMETDRVAHPGQAMTTMFVLDVDRLVVNHYCASHRHPRLLATSANEDLSRVEFSFVDALNLPSRDVGHMDGLVVNFKGPDEFTAKWSWYEKGKESWMEEVVHTRVK